MQVTCCSPALQLSTAELLEGVIRGLQRARHGSDARGGGDHQEAILDASGSQQGATLAHLCAAEVWPLLHNTLRFFMQFYS